MCHKVGEWTRIIMLIGSAAKKYFFALENLTLNNYKATRKQLIDFNKKLRHTMQMTNDRPIYV